MLTDHPFTSAIIVAAGSSERMGKDKIFMNVLGKPVICYSVEAFEKSVTTDEIIIVTSFTKAMKTLAAEQCWKKVVCVTPGGSTRSLSVKNGFDKISPESRFVSIHDGARPLIDSTTIDEAHRKAYETNAVCVGYKVADTLKTTDKNGLITSTPDRSTLFFAATPQIFARHVYEKSLCFNNTDTFTDDAALVCAAGFQVHTFLCSERNFKLTCPQDIRRMEAELQAKDT